MNSEQAETPQQQPQGGLASAGAQLKAQREALGWPVEQVADQLKLAPRQVIALEQGDTAALPNVAVVRGFVRAYAKVVRLDAAPLVALIEVAAAPTQDPATPVRREISATFSESRFPSMTHRSSSSPVVWIVGAVVVVAVAAFGAYKLGYVPAALMAHVDKEKEADHPAMSGPVETTLIKPGQDMTPVQTPSVPLISVPPPANDTQTGTAASAAASVPAAAAPAAPAPAPAPEAAAVTPPAAAASANALVLKIEQDSWVEIRRRGTTPLVSRMMRAGSTETFNIAGPATLVVGKPGAVQATLRGAKLDLPTVPGGTIARVSIE
ncbi:helix-turn-helix domain-containing protein [Janthinobacterium sp.]|uniref:helix-turn-helix domain-containing protein n=1 Tax=Janthinobacterium sp. TaxID=1871054 RepID=UPI0026335DD0|nr:helix-turn-helix domain-containing protein [Janthinobacterium sp.]